jgi:hypothetical protein
MSDPLEQARQIVGRVRTLGNDVYMDDYSEDKHRKLDELLLSLVEKDYPELAAYIRKLKLWYG